MKPNELRQSLSSMESLSQEIQLLRKELQGYREQVPKQIEKLVAARLAPMELTLSKLSNSLTSLHSALTDQTAAQRQNAQQQAAQIAAMIQTLQLFKTQNEQPL